MSGKSTELDISDRKEEEDEDKEGVATMNLCKCRCGGAKMCNPRVFHGQ